MGVMKQRKAQRAPAGDGWLSHERVLALVLVAATVIAIYLCYLLLHPFLPPLAWALALAVVGYPLHSWLAGRIRHDNLAATITVTVIALVVIGPALVLTERLAAEAQKSFHFEDFSKTSGWKELVKRAPVLEWFQTHVD